MYAIRSYYARAEALEGEDAVVVAERRNDVVAHPGLERDLVLAQQACRVATVDHVELAVRRRRFRARNNFV